MKILVLSVLVILSVLSINDAFANNSEVTITTASGSGAPGCEKTAGGCYIPKEASVYVGGKVIFLNTDTAAHTFTSGDAVEGPSGTFDTSLGGWGEWTPTVAGEVPYFCMVHPWMTGIIFVKDYENPDDAPVTRKDVSLPTIYSETESTIHFGINKERYYDSQKISIIGTLDYFVADENVLLRIFSPTNKLVYEQFSPVLANTFYGLVRLENRNWDESGTYKISASYANEKDALLNFEFSKNTPEVTKTVTYYIPTVTKGKIPMKTILTNIDFLSFNNFNQESSLIFTIISDMEIQGKQKLILEIPRELIDSKDESGKDIPFNISYQDDYGKLHALIADEQTNDSIRKITLEIGYIEEQTIIIITGTHSEGFRYSLKSEPILDRTVKLGINAINQRNFHLDSDENIILLHDTKWMKFNNEGKLLIEFKPQMYIESFYADSNDNLYTAGSATFDGNTIYKFSSDFKLLKEFSTDAGDKSIQNTIIGIDYQDNIWYRFDKCYKISPNFEILDTANNCDSIKSNKNTDSNRNYYWRVYGTDLVCKFSSNDILLGQFSIDGSVGGYQDMSLPELNLDCKTSALFENRGILVDSNDNVYVQNSQNIQKFSPELKLQIILKPEFKDVLLTVDDKGDIYVADDKSGNIKVYSQTVSTKESQIEKTDTTSSLSNITPESQPKITLENNELGIASFVDQTKDPQSYVDRYNNEPKYKEWFDENYPQYSSIYQAVGLDESRIPTIDNTITQCPKGEKWVESAKICMTPEPQSTCGQGTELVDGTCQVIKTEEKGGGCLIATATYGSELAPQVQQLRELRDNSLLQTASGTSFMKSFNEFYYTFSPTIADWERESPVFKELVKVTLTPMISSLSILNYVDMDSEVSVLGYGISLIILNVGMYFVAPAVVIIGIKKKL